MKRKFEFFGSRPYSLDGPLWVLHFLIHRIGWTPLLLLVITEVITGNGTFYQWDMISGALYAIILCGDSLILLIFDKRWNSAIRDMASDIKKKFR
jgi:hypothetical protein